jgi:hypothetical protein
LSIDKSKIGLVTTVANWELYNKTKSFFPSGLKYFAVDGTSGLYGLRSLVFVLEKLRNYDLDWLIMADEDVIFTDEGEVFELIEYMDKGSFSASGVRDGGQLEWRNKNPHVLNTFFCILNLKEIFKIYNRKEMLSQQVIFRKEFDDTEISFLPFKNYDTTSLFEPYYCFFLWLLRKGKKINYLMATNPVENDYATTLVRNNAGNDILFHTWYARFYGKEEFHTQRIKKIIDLGVKTSGLKRIVLLKNYPFTIKKFFYTISRKIVRKTNNFKR